MELTNEQALQQGVAAHKKGKLQEAERLYRAILQSQPLHPDANHNLGVIAVSVNKAGAALALFKTALQANPKIELFWHSYIDALIKENQNEVAKQVIGQAKKQGMVGDKLDFFEKQLIAAIQINGPERVKKNRKQYGHGINPPDADLKNLLQLYQNSQYEDAEKLALSLAERFPKHPFPWKVLGVVLKQTGRIIESLIPMQKSVRLAPQDAAAHSNLGITLQELGRLEEAEASYTQAISLKPDFAKAHYNLGITLKELGRLDEAEASYTQAIALKPDYAQAHSNLGNTLKELGRLDEAEASYTEAIALNPDDAEAHSNLGNTLKELGRLDEAVASHTQAIALKPDNAEAYSNLGSTLKELGRLDEAEASYTRAIALKPDYAEAYNNLGNTLQELSKLDEAEASYSQAIALNPDDAEAHSNLGNILQELGRLDEAEASHTQAIALKFDFAEGHYNLGITLFELGKLDEAEASYTEAIALRHDYAEAHYNLGITLQEQGRIDVAEASYTQAIALKPDYAEAHNNLGTTLQELGRLDEAEASYTQAIGLKPDFADAAQNLVKLPVGQLDLETLDLCDKALFVEGATVKNQASYYFSKANLLKHKGLMKQSFDEFYKANKLKWEEVREQYATQDREITENLNRIKQWTPNVPELDDGRLTKLFLMGPSRSGKSSLEHLLNKSSQVKPLYEGISYSGLSKAIVNGKDSSETLFEKLFSQSEDEFLTEGYQVVTSTRPDSIFYSDYLIDMLPNTYFIIIERNLRDVASEIFTTEYTKGHFYSYDPNEISTYLGDYNKMCETLALKVPKRCITISFEDIINNPEETIERIGGLVCRNFEVGRLKKYPTSFKSKSLFRDHFARINKSSKI